MKLTIDAEKLWNMEHLNDYVILSNIEEAKLEDGKIILEGENKEKLWDYLEKGLNFTAWITASFCEEEENFGDIENKIYSELAEIFKLVVEEN